MTQTIKTVFAGVAALATLIVGLLVLLTGALLLHEPLRVYVAERGAEAVLGRNVQVGGVSLPDLGMTTTIELTDVRVPNPDWAREPNLFRAPRVRAAVEVTGLFPPSAALRRVSVEEPAAHLMVAENGRTSWGGLLSGGGQGGGQGSGQGSGTDLLGLRQLRVAGGAVTYRDAAEDRNLRLHGIDVTAPAADQPVTFDARGRVGAGDEAGGGPEIRISGKTGSLQRIRQGELPVDATLTAGAATATVDGRITRPFGDRALDLRLVAKGDDLGTVMELAGVTVESTPGFHLEAHLVGQSPQWRAEELHARLGRSEVDGNASVDISGPRPMIRGDLTVSPLDVATLRELAGQGASGGTDGSPFRWLRVADAELALRAERIRYPGVPLQSVSTTATLRDGTLSLDPLRVEAAEGTVTGTLRIDSTASPPTMALQAEARGLAVGAMPGVPQAVTATLSGTADVRTAGTTVGAMLTALEGTAQATVDGRLRDQPLHLTVSAGPRPSGSAGAIPFELTGRAGAATVTASGQVPIGDGGAPATFRLVGEGPNVGPLLTLAGIDHPSDTPSFRVEAEGRKRDRRWSLTIPTMRLGETEASGTASVNLSGDVPMLRADLTIPHLSWPAVERTGAVPSGAPAAPENGQVIPDTPIPLGALTNVDAEVTVTVGSVAGAPVPVGGGRLDATVRDGVLRVDPLRVEVADGTVRVTATADATPSVPTVDATVSLDAISVDQLMTALDVSKRVSGRIGGRMELRSSGGTLQALAGNLDGSVDLSMDEGQFTTRMIDALAFHAREALGFLFSGGAVRPVDCFVGRFEIEDGTVSPDALAFVTNDMVVRGQGTIDLAAENVHLDLIPRPKRRHLLDLTVPVRVRGPLADPNINVGVSLITELARSGVCKRLTAEER